MATADLIQSVLCAPYVKGVADSVVCFDEQGRVAYPRLSEGRNAAANGQLFALESSTNRTGPQFTETVARLHERVNDYTTNALSSAQRRFLIHELQRLDPGLEFPTQAGEELAARYLETNPVFVRAPVLHATELRDVWSVGSVWANQLVLALFTTDGLAVETLTDWLMIRTLTAKGRKPRRGFTRR